VKSRLSRGQPEATTGTQGSRVAIVTNVLSQYRLPCFEELSARLDGRLTVFTLDTDMKHRRYVLASASGDDLSVVPLRGIRRSRPPADDKHLNLIMPVVRSHPTLLVLGGWDEPTYILLLAWARLRGVPSMFWVESTASDLPRTAARERFKSFLLQGVSGCITPGRRAAEYCRQLGMPEDRIFTAPNATDRKFFSVAAGDLAPRRRELRQAKGLSGYVVLFVGRLVEAYKGVATLIEACAVLAKRGTTCTLLLVGDGEDASSYASLARSREVEGIRFLGTLAHAELCEYYATSDVLVLPSLGEPWGFVINEAMEFGLPIVASDRVGAAADLLRTGENGYVFPAGDAGALADALETLAGNEALRATMGARSRAMIESFSPERWADGLMEAVDAVDRTRRELLSR
jgi:glycosyltransferase involved in cell wall biosynthesis